MMLRGYFRVMAVLASFLLAISSSSAEDRADEKWLRSSGEDLQIVLRGEVLEADGRPATDLTMMGSLNGIRAKQPLEPQVDGNHFELSLPVNRVAMYALWLRAASASGDRVAYLKLNAFELRQAAIDGVKLTLQSPTRRVQVKVTDKGRPVPGALVKAELDFGIELRARADDEGVARIGLLPDQNLTQLTAWTDDFRIGGFNFFRKPIRNPAASEQVVELSACRSQTLRFVDEQGKPVPDVSFVLQVATAPPEYNFLGGSEHSSLTTDAAGEAIYRWFPDWDKHHVQIDLNTSRWILDGEPKSDSAAIVAKLKRSRDRKQVQGRVASTGDGAGGFSVTLDSFQGEREGERDVLQVFTNSDGTFAVDVLPDATYCAYALDSRWVGEIIHVKPYHSKPKLVTEPKLSVSTGQQVEVIVTTGPHKKPYPNLTISLKREHAYSWREEGGLRHGTSGPQWWATTDAAGRAVIGTLPGKLTASVYTPAWRAGKEIEVQEGKAATIELHREAEEKRRVTGRLALPAGLAATVSGAELQIGAVDGNYDDRQTVASAEDGSFSFETPASQIGIFALTKDGRAAGATIVQDLSAPLELPLRPTIDYQGRLLGKAGKPLVGHKVRATIPVQGKANGLAFFATSFQAKTIEAKTDEQGNFSLAGLPGGMKIDLAADALDDAEGTKHLDAVFLQPNELRPRAVFRLAPKDAAAIPLAKQYETKLRDGKLLGYRLMIVLCSDADAATRFVERNFVDHDTNEQVYDYLQIVLARQQDNLPADEARFLKERKWNFPGRDRIAAFAIDAQGKELGRLEIDLAAEAAATQAADFVQRHLPPRVDAEQKWREAFAEAKRSDRRVWVRVSQRYCGPCFSLARWLDDHREVLEKDYVLLKIDDYRDPNGARVANRLTGGKNHGVPFHAIFDRDERMRIDSQGPLGNIGHPSGFEGTQHLRKMLLETRQKLTDAEIERLVKSLETIEEGP